MAKKKTESLKKMEVKESGVERTKSGTTYIPFTDIIEGETGLTVIMDVPGVESGNVDIHLEDNILTVTGIMDDYDVEGFSPLYSEYSIGDYERSFKMVEKFDAEKIEAELKDGILKLWLPKQAKVKPRKIKVKS